MYLMGACAPIGQVPLQFVPIRELNEGEQDDITRCRWMNEQMNTWKKEWWVKECDGWMCNGSEWCSDTGVFVSVTGERVITCGLSGECLLLFTSVRSETFLLWPRANVCNTYNWIFKTWCFIFLVQVFVSHEQNDLVFTDCYVDLTHIFSHAVPPVLDL